MAPYELENMTLKQLRETRSAMSQLEYLLEVEKLSTEKRKEAATLSDNIQMTYLKFRNQELANIRDKLIENETDLTNGIDSLQEVLNDLKKVEKIMATAGAFLGIVARIIPLV